MRLLMVGDTDRGLVRKNNQDSIFFDAALGLGVVADGIGGRKGGEIASSLAVEVIKNTFMKSDRIRHEEMVNFMTTSVDRANRKVYQHGLKDKKVKGMGTTLNCLMFSGSKVHIAHVGDSRTYLYDRGNMWQLTMDHSVENFVRRGLLDADMILPGAKPDALTRAVGLMDDVEVDIYQVSLKKGQILLTCSDGLSGMVPDRKTAQVIQRYENQLDKLPARLIKEAKLGGGKDNITVLLSTMVDI